VTTTSPAVMETAKTIPSVSTRAIEPVRIIVSLPMILVVLIQFAPQSCLRCH
jgi:hypothetical protein